MHCNYNCIGCYSRGRSTENELSTEELDSLLSDPEEFGVLAIVITGGEPLLRKDIIEIIVRHKRLLFTLIANGSLMGREVSLHIAKSDNIVTIISIDGFINYTDERRKVGAYDDAIKAFKLLNEAGACYGFAATNTKSNTDHLGRDEFIDQMIDLGYFTEYLPCDSNPNFNWILNQDERADFRKKVLDLRCRKQIVIIQFPNDEYGSDNKCKTAGYLSLHINSQGGIEPCPFVPISCENIRNEGLITACQSPFMRSIREHPDLLKRKKYACSLFEQFENVKRLASQ